MDIMARVVQKATELRARHYESVVVEMGMTEFAEALDSVMYVHKHNEEIVGGQIAGIPIVLVAASEHLRVLGLSADDGYGGKGTMLARWA